MVPLKLAAARGADRSRGLRSPRCERPRSGVELPKRQSLRLSPDSDQIADIAANPFSARKADMARLGMHFAV
jgi:hypothetical protein